MTTATTGHTLTITTTDDDDIAETVYEAARVRLPVDLLIAISEEVATHGSAAIDIGEGVCDVDGGVSIAGTIVRFLDSGRAALITNADSVWGDMRGDDMTADEAA